MTRLEELENLINKYKEKIEIEDYEEIIETIGMLEAIEKAPLLQKFYAKLSEVSSLPISNLNIQITPFEKVKVEIDIDLVEEKDSKSVVVKLIFEKQINQNNWQTTIQYNHKLIKEHQEKLIESVESIKQYLTEVA